MNSYGTTYFIRDRKYKTSDKENRGKLRQTQFCGATIFPVFVSLKIPIIRAKWEKNNVLEWIFAGIEIFIWEKNDDFEFGPRRVNKCVNCQKVRILHKVMNAKKLIIFATLIAGKGTSKTKFQSRFIICGSFILYF